MVTFESLLAESINQHLLERIIAKALTDPKKAEEIAFPFRPDKRGTEAPSTSACRGAH
jgi:hypothetical protein